MYSNIIKAIASLIVGSRVGWFIFLAFAFINANYIIVLQHMHRTPCFLRTSNSSHAGMAGCIGDSMEQEHSYHSLPFCLQTRLDCCFVTVTVVDIAFL